MSSSRAWRGLTTTRRSTTSDTLGGVQLSRSRGLDGISSSSTAYRITLANTDRLRAMVVALAALPSCLTEIASRIGRACWGLLIMLTGSEAFSSQRSAAAMAGGRSSSRDAGASAKCLSASRIALWSVPSGGGSLVTAGMMVARASVSASRVFGAADGHFMSV